MKKSFIIFLFAGVSLFAQKFDTLKVDVVELFNGKEVAGTGIYSSSVHRYVYFFSNQANKKLFDENSEKYKIQLGGACGRMGPLSGAGSTSIFTVLKDKLYIFASQECKNTFLKRNEELIETDDPVPAPSMEDVEKGKTLLAGVLLAHGGADKFNSVSSYGESYSKEIEYQNTNVKVSDVSVYSFPGKYRIDNYWDKYKWARILNGSKGIFSENPDSRIMDDSQIRAAKKVAAHNLFYLLKSASAGNGIIYSAGKSEFAGNSYEVINIYAEGTLHSLLINKNGRIYGVQYTGRGPGLFIGRIENYYSDYKVVDGIILPATITTLFNNMPVPSLTKTASDISVNKQYTEDFFSF